MTLIKPKSSTEFEELHNHITGFIVHYINKKKIIVSEAVLILDMIRLDLVSQVSNKAYTKKPIQFTTKKPTKIGDKDGRIQKNTT